MRISGAATRDTVQLSGIRMHETGGGVSSPHPLIGNIQRRTVRNRLHADTQYKKIHDLSFDFGRKYAP